MGWNCNVKIFLNVLWNHREPFGCSYDVDGCDHSCALELQSIKWHAPNQDMENATHWDSKEDSGTLSYVYFNLQ
jgi:hypothetical protein